MRTAPAVCELLGPYHYRADEVKDIHCCAPTFDNKICKNIILNAALFFKVNTERVRNTVEYFNLL